MIGRGCALLALLGGVAACSPREVEDKRRQLLESWTRDVVLANYAELESQAGELESKSRSFCESPSEAGLLAARDAWWVGRGAWKRTEVFAFGPYQESPWRLGPKIDFWPARPESIEAVLTGTEPLTHDAVEVLGAATKGLPVIEYLLYEEGDGTLAAFGAQPRRCEYLIALALDLGERAREIYTAWDSEGDNYQAELVEAGRGSESFATLQGALGEVVNRMGFTLENIQADKLGKPLGHAAGGVPQPGQLESRYSGRSVEDIQDNVRGIETLFFGDAGRGIKGLDSYLDARGRHFDVRMREAIAGVDRALSDIGMPLSEAIEVNPGAVETASQRVGELQRLIQVDIINALSLTVSFNDNDGD